MNNKFLSAALAAVTAFVVTSTLAEGSSLPPWRDRSVNAINRLPPRALVVPCESEELAIAIGNGDADPEESRWVQKLSGTWDFAWKPNPDGDWQKTAKVAVPGCWQLQGAFDPALYTNVPYPVGFDGSGDPMVDPPTNYTAFAMRNPVGRYTTTFSRPWRWWFRRTVIRFLGVSSAFYVRVNGHAVGYSEDSRLPAEFDLTPYLNIFAENTLEVEVYKHCDGTYLEDQDFWRLSGIFRDVYLISERKGAPKDFIAETTLSDDLKSGGFVIRDENGNVLKERKVPEVQLWSDERPCVYLTPMEYKWGWWIFGGTEHYAVTFGFRKLEIRDSVLYLNGKRLIVRGANRHEMEPATGYAVTRAGMYNDIELAHMFNINAIRSCHYPNAPEWYDICDREGIMTVCEANIESHGAGYGEKTLAKVPEWKQSHLERVTRMFGFYRNHPSICFWSLGNEAGDGENFVACYKALKALDATRPIQYERAENAAHTDIYCPMYTPPAECEKYVAAKPAKPMILCEYTHAMGNSNGGASEYWDLVKKYPSFQGGFVWDFVDQAVWNTDGRGTWLAYGGDFGDVPNDGNFNCNGLFDALRNPHPGAFELMHCYRPVRVTSFDFKTGAAVIRSDYNFITLKDFECVVTTEKGGKPLDRVELKDIAELAPGAEKQVKIDVKDADAVLFTFLRDGDRVAWDSFAKPFVAAKQPPVGAAWKDHPFKLNFWRAPTDNDRGWGMPGVCKVWKDATATQKLPAGVTSDLRVNRAAGGGILVDWTLVVPKGLPPIPRVGLTFTAPKTAEPVAWYGLGPWENYSDRATAAWLGSFLASPAHVNGLRDEKSKTIAYAGNKLNPDNYIEPGEQGYRTQCRSLKVGKVEVTAINAPFGFNVWPYPQTELEGKAHQWEIAEADRLTVNVDAAQMGVGGDNSWGARPHEPYMLGAGTYRLVFKIRGL